MRFALSLLLALGVSLVGTATLNATHNHVEPGAISGTVTDAHGHAVGGARVEVEIHARDGRVFHARTRTDRQGHFAFPRVAPGKGVIGAGKRGVGRDRQRILVHPGEHIRVHLELH